MKTTGDIRDAHTLHLTALRRLGRSTSTIKGYQLYVGAYIRFLEERGRPLELSSLNVSLAGDFQDWVRARSVGTRDGAAAERHSVRLLKVFSRFLWRRGFFEHDPLARVKEPHLPRLHRAPFSAAEVRRLVEAARLGPNPVLERALLLVGLDTGARIGELCGADVDDVDLQEHSILFRYTKSRRPRRVFFGVEGAPGGGPCADALRAWLAVRTSVGDNAALFTTADGERLTTGQARRIYTALGTAASVRHCHPHRGRHTHATELLHELPGAEIHLRKRLGHLSKDVLEDYVTISDPMAQQIASVASLSAKWAL